MLSSAILKSGADVVNSHRARPHLFIPQHMLPLETRTFCRRESGPLTYRSRGFPPADYGHVWARSVGTTASFSHVDLVLTRLATLGHTRRGDSSQRYRVQAMSLDDLLFAGRTVVAEEAHRGPSVEDLIAAAPGVSGSRRGGHLRGVYWVSCLFKSVACARPRLASPP